MTFTCIRCTADTDNDDDICDACAEEARRAPTTIGERQAIAGVDALLDSLRQDICQAIQDNPSPYDATEAIMVELRNFELARMDRTPMTNAPVADAREEAVKLITAHLEWLAYGQQDDDRDEYTLADAILALRQTLPIHGEMREAAQAVLDEAGSIAMTMRRRRIFDNLRNALQGDGL